MEWEFQILSWGGGGYEQKISHLITTITPSFFPFHSVFMRTNMFET